MSWETIVQGMLEGVSSFVYSLISIIGGSINPTAVEGLIAIFAISIIYRICQGGVRVPKKKKKDEEDEYEWAQVRKST